MTFKRARFASGFDLLRFIEDEWIENIEELEAQMDQYIHLRQQARNAFDLRYESSVEPEANRWELCSRVLSRQDIIAKLSEPW